MSDTTVEWRCLVCVKERRITVTLPPRRSIDEGPEYTLEPACSGVVDYYTEGGGAYHERLANEVAEELWTNTPHCPFDGQDDWQTGDQDAVLAILRERRRWEDA